MGMYLNPGNSGFEEIRNSRYVDKSGLISLVNRTIGTKQKLTCVSRPRRFGKSFAAQMLCAYYDRSCDSSGLFGDLAIAVDEKINGSYHRHLNQYDVIYLDMTNIMGKTTPKDILSFIETRVTEELLCVYPKLKAESAFDETLLSAVNLTGSKFIMLIDEWDAPIREIPEIQKMYLQFLRTLFKGSGTTDRIFAAVYMTGILPIRKDGSQSAISDFQEYTMVFPGAFSEYVGLTEKEVKELCEEYHNNFSEMKQWYDGYTLEETGSIYNPNSVMAAIRNKRYRSYWTETSASKNLMEYISLDFDGLSRTVAQLLGGVSVCVDTSGFSNDLVTFRDRDDVLTLLIHLGYLAYQEDTRTVRIPNEEIRLEFARAIRGVKRDETICRIRESNQLIYDTIHQKEEAVAAQIEKIHGEETAILFYIIGKSSELPHDTKTLREDAHANAEELCRLKATRLRRRISQSEILIYNNEQSLRSVIKLAYFSYKDYYLKFEELPAGDGYADIVYLPKKTSPVPALVIELKWNRSAEGAIDQIRRKRYPEALKGYGGEVLLVGIGYDKKAGDERRKHTCKIEKVIV